MGTQEVSGASPLATGLSSAAPIEPVPVSPVPASIPSAVKIPNPVRWYYHREQDAEWWHRGGEAREDAIDKGIAEYEGEPFYIAECKSMVPHFGIFDADDICERLGEDEEAWWEDGWTGEPLPPAKRELENRLEATFKQWFAEFATLDGACLDQLSGEFVTAQVIEARRSETQSGSVHESAVLKGCAQPQVSETPSDTLGGGEGVMEKVSVHAAAFMAANRRSPVVSGSVVGDGGKGAHYTLANGKEFTLSVEECHAIGMPRWKL